MKIKQVVGEHKKGVRAVKYNAKPQTHIEPPKPRNFVAKNATTSGAGAHKDKKKAAKQGEVKHKAQSIPMGEADAGISKDKETKFHAKLDKLVHNTFGKRDDEVGETRYGRRDAYQRDYDSSISGMDTSRRYRQVDDEANLMYRYNSETGKLVQKMVDVRDEREAKSMGYRYEWKDALRVANIIQSKFNPNKFVQKQGDKWVPVNPFKDKEAKSDDVAEGEGKVTAVDPAKGVEITNPETGVKTTIPPKMSSALAPDKTNPNRYTLNPQAVSGGDEKDTASGPKVGSQVAIPDQATEEDMMVPPSDSQSPIHGGTVDGDEAGNRDHDTIIHLLKKLAGVREMDNGPVSVQVGSKGDMLGMMKKLGGL